jgi:hypothetical protein
MPFVNFNKETLAITSIGIDKRDTSLEISTATFKKIMSGEMPEIYILRHPKNDSYVLSETEYFSWFKWANHDSENFDNRIKIKLKMNQGARIVVSMPGNGNMVYGIFTVNEDCDEYVVPLEMGIDDVDIFVSKDYDEKI